MEWCGSRRLLAAFAALACAAAAGEDTCQDASGECTADETPLLQLQPKSALSARPAQEQLLGPKGNFSADVVAVNQLGAPFPGPRGQAAVVACFSGGGTRAMTVALGAWRGLHALDLAGKFDGVSSVSGGTWGNSQYMFGKKDKATGKDLDDYDLVGQPTTPAELTMAFLANTSSTIAASGNISTDTALLEYVLKNAAKCGAVNVLDGNVSKCVQDALRTGWVDVYGSVMLGAYGLDGSAYMAASDEAVQSIVERNPSLKHLTKFVTPRTDRPKSYVMLGVVDAPSGYIAGTRNLVSFQMSADYTGSPYYPDGKDVLYVRAISISGPSLFDKKTVGGGFVETFAFGGLAPEDQSGGTSPAEMPAPKAPFRLSDAVGISSQAEATLFTKAKVTQNLDPTQYYWPVTKSADRHQEAELYTLGDGGSLDNLGVIPMLQSGAEKVVVFFAASVGITEEVDLCKVSPDYSNLTYSASVDLASLFGLPAPDTLDFIYSHNWVFEKVEYQPLLCGLQSLRNEGKPAVFKQSLMVRDNEWWGIVGGRQVEVLWYYLESVSDFVDALPPDTKAEVAKKGEGPFPNYPIYQTILQNPPEFTAYPTEQINLLAAQVEYSVRQNEALYKDFLS